MTLKASLGKKRVKNLAQTLFLFPLLVHYSSMHHGHLHFDGRPTVRGKAEKILVENSKISPFTPGEGPEMAFSVGGPGR
jgi:hypothetical protein